MLRKAYEAANPHGSLYLLIDRIPKLSGKKAPAGKAAAGKMVTAKHKKKTIRNIHKKK